MRSTFITALALFSLTDARRDREERNWRVKSKEMIAEWENQALVSQDVQQAFADRVTEMIEKKEKESEKEAKAAAKAERLAERARK